MTTASLDCIPRPRLLQVLEGSGEFLWRDRVNSCGATLLGSRCGPERAALQIGFPAASGRVEADPLRERQIAGVVHRCRRAAHVLLPGIAARFASAAGLLLAAERATDLGPAGADVHIHDATVGSRGTAEPLGL